MIYRKIETNAAEIIVNWAENNSVLCSRLWGEDGYVDIGFEDWDVLPSYLKGCLPDEDVIDIIFEAGLRDLYENVAKWLLETKQIANENGMGDLGLWPSDAVETLVKECGNLRVYCDVRTEEGKIADFEASLEDAFKISKVFRHWVNDGSWVNIYLWIV